jgi:hypothetical protein
MRNVWKSALLDVFLDESTIFTPMGAWLDAHVHQESEWWMKGREWCIFRHTNGEWSQYAHHNFSRLHFSTTPMPVPRPDQCSTRIQVTQITQYLEVTAKVNIVIIQYIVPTPLHSYTSCIGLSLLSLPRHIQRLTCDIPTLPTSLSFDINEPVDLIIATDGSVLFGVGYHGWVLATKYETILLLGGGPDDEIQSLMTSYRSELGGLVAGLAVPGPLFHTGAINILSVQFNELHLC